MLVGRDESGFVMAVLPASCELNLPLLRIVTGRTQLVLASEGEIRELFPDCEVGALPPFGKLYGLPVYADRCLATDGEVPPPPATVVKRCVSRGAISCTPRSRSSRTSAGTRRRSWNKQEPARPS